MTAGKLQRKIWLVAGSREARGLLHDDFHHFRVRIEHDGRHVTAVHAETRRGPFSLCPAAGAELQALVGVELTPRASRIFAGIDARLQCTHQYDLAAFTIGTAFRGENRQYELTVTDPVDGLSRAVLLRDGVRILEWQVRNYAIEGPPPYAGLGLGHGFTDWVSRNLDDPEAEAALVLRRGVFVTRGRSLRAILVESRNAPATGGCWVQQPERATLAIRPVDVIRDYSDTGVPLDENDQAWLACVQ